MGQGTPGADGEIHTAELADHLTALGVSGNAVELYLALLSCSGPRARDAAGTEAMRELVRLGLVVHGHGGAPTPVPPLGALELLARRGALRLEEARAAVAGAYEHYRRHHSEAGGGVVAEEVTGEEIERRLGGALAEARTEVLRFDTPPYFWDSERGATTETAMLRRGVAHRAVYARASLAHPGHLSGNVQPCIEAGEQARVLPELPVKLTVVDDRIGFVGLSLAEVEVNRGLLVVRPSGLLTALRALFEACWDRALPIQASGSTATGSGVRPGPTERRILAMLVAGVPDSQIIRELGVSRRTFFRRMELLSAQAGAGSRFQLALQAQRRGWL